jgi:hypothetical protein
MWTATTGSGRNYTGVTPNLDYEIIAKRNTKYLYRLTKIAAGDCYVDIDSFWYEHTPKN